MPKIKPLQGDRLPIDELPEMTAVPAKPTLLSRDVMTELISRWHDECPFVVAHIRGV